MKVRHGVIYSEMTNKGRSSVRYIKGAKPVYCFRRVAEIIHFADNEGCFDWLICQELIKDFEKYYDRAKSLLDNSLEDFYWQLYTDTMQVLRDCIVCQGVVLYD